MPSWVSQSSRPRKVSCSPMMMRGIWWRMAVPVHMAQGERVEASVSLCQSRLRPAFRMQVVSACAVGSSFCTRWL